VTSDSQKIAAASSSSETTNNSGVFVKHNPGLAVVEWTQMTRNGYRRHDHVSATSLLLFEPSHAIEWSAVSARPKASVDAWEHASKPPRVRETRWLHGPAALLTAGTRIEHGLFEPALSLFAGADEHPWEVPDHAVYTVRVHGVAAAASDSAWGPRERINFGFVIGEYFDKGVRVGPTMNAIVHYSKKGVHFVPARP